jgi:hypothetical protein
VYGTPQAPLVPYSPLDLELAMNDIVGPGPSFPPTYDGRADAGWARNVSGDFISNLFKLAESRVEAPSSTDTLLPCLASGPNPGACLDGWIRERGLHIYRRPLSDEQVGTYIVAFNQERVSSSSELAAKKLLLSMLLSPYFVYRIELGDPTSRTLTIAPPGIPLPQPTRGNPLSAYEIAARLSHFAWRSSPDNELLDKAAHGGLAQAADVLVAFERLLNDPRSVQARTQQQLEWLHLEQWGKLEPKAPSETERLEREQTERFITDVLTNRGGSLTQLLTSARQPLNDTLAQELGVLAMPGKDFMMVELDPIVYAGVLGQPAWLRLSPRPSQRGVRIMSQFLCQEVPAPPPNEPPLGPGATPRERINSVTMANPACQACHSFFDPAGFALEAFDDRGRLTGFDSSGSLRLPGTGEIRSLAGPRELGLALASGSDTKSCAAQRAVEYLLQTTHVGEIQPLTSCITSSLGSGDLSLNDLARQIAISAAMLRTLREPSTAIGVGKSSDPVEHAIEETQGLVATLPPEDSVVLQNYQYALMELRGLPTP